MHHGHCTYYLNSRVTSAKYVFRLEFKHVDETGVQWITAAKSRNSQEYEAFKLKEVELKQFIG